MTIQIELKPEAEARLRDRAAARGETVEALAGELLHSLLDPAGGPAVTPLAPVVDDQGVFRQDRWDAVLASVERGSREAPVLPPEALTREAMYQDHD
jgi:hypothetical protein